MFPELFNDGLRKLKNVETKLYVDSEAMPRCFKPRTVPLALRGKVDKELDRLQAQGVIIPVEHSELAAPIVSVFKANSEVRICGDYKLIVNTSAKTDQYPIPNIEDLYSKLAGVVYSKLDLSHASFSIHGCAMGYRLHPVYSNARWNNSFKAYRWWQFTSMMS